jgi:NAD(P)H-dependent flavin oxidoreductase YrpB (nitropropane dioxygenase family)
MMASRFMATHECHIHTNIKNELVRHREHETALICKSIHLQARALKNKNQEAFVFYCQVSLQHEESQVLTETVLANISRKSIRNGYMRLQSGKLLYSSYLP